MKAIGDSEKEAPRRRKSAVTGKMADRQYETQQKSIETALMDLQAYILFFKLAFGADSSIAGADWIRERAYAVQCRRAGVKLGELGFQGLLLWLRPALKGSLEQSAAAAFYFYDFNGNGLLSAQEVMDMIELQPVDSNDERDLLHLITYHGGKHKSYSFGMYLEHAQAFGMHGSYVAFRKRLLDP